MRDLNYDLKQLCRHSRDGSYATQADREHILDLIADQLHEMGFRHMNAPSKQLTAKQKAIDREARGAISREMGHGREQITAVYLGR